MLNIGYTRQFQSILDRAKYSDMAGRLQPPCACRYVYTYYTQKNCSSVVIKKHDQSHKKEWCMDILKVENWITLSTGLKYNFVTSWENQLQIHCKYFKLYRENRPCTGPRCESGITGLRKVVNHLKVTFSVDSLQYCGTWGIWDDCRMLCTLTIKASINFCKRSQNFDL
jgi:hypothetical protein